MEKNIKVRMILGSVEKIARGDRRKASGWVNEEVIVLVSVGQISC